jgi:predicted secreted protein
MAMNGTDVLVLVNTGTAAVPVYEVVGSQRDSTFDETTDPIDVSSKDSRAQRVLPGRYSAGVSFDALYVPTNEDYLALRAAMRDGEMILIARQVQGTVIEIVDALITSLSESFPDQGEAAISISAIPDGFWEELGS